MFANHVAGCLAAAWICVFVAPLLLFSLFFRLLSLAVVGCLILWWANLRMSHLAHAHRRCHCHYSSCCWRCCRCCLCCVLLFSGSLIVAAVVAFVIWLCKTWQATAPTCCKWHTNDTWEREQIKFGKKRHLTNSCSKDSGSEISRNTGSIFFVNVLK